jgi:hypothetical protein
MSATKNTKLKWEEISDSEMRRSYGPLTLVVYRAWGPTPIPTHYTGYLNFSNIGIISPYVVKIEDVTAETGLAWHDDELLNEIQYRMHKWAAAQIRLWIK